MHLVPIRCIFLPIRRSRTHVMAPIPTLSVLPDPWSVMSVPLTASGAPALALTGQSILGDAGSRCWLHHRIGVVGAAGGRRAGSAPQTGRDKHSGRTNTRRQNSSATCVWAIIGTADAGSPPREPGCADGLRRSLPRRTATRRATILVCHQNTRGIRFCEARMVACGAVLRTRR